MPLQLVSFDICADLSHADWGAAGVRPTAYSAYSAYSTATAMPPPGFGENTLFYGAHSQGDGEWQVKETYFHKKETCFHTPRLFSRLGLFVV